MRTLAFAVLASLSAVPRAQDEVAFDQGHAAVRALMQKGKWQEAKAAIDALLPQHEGKLYVLAQKSAIVGEYELCSFWSATAVPQAKDLLTGAVESYAADGRIRIRYRRGQWGDWADAGEGMFVHPAVFAGGYSLTVIDDSYPGDDSSMRMVFDLDDESFHVADFGFAPRSAGRGTVRLGASIRSISQGGETRVLAEKELSPAKQGQNYTAQLKVTKNSVEMAFDRKSVLKVPRARDDFGQVGLMLENLEEVVLEGDIEPAWLQGLVDQKLAVQREEFAGRFRATEVLPKWLFATPAVQRTDPHEIFDAAHARSKAGRAVFAQLQRGEIQPALAALEALGDADLKAADRAFLLGVCHFRLGDADAALPFAEQALAAAPDRTRMRVLQAEVWSSLRRGREALPLLRQAVADDPGDFEATEALFVALMRASDVAGAEQLVRDARCKHGLWEETKPLDDMLTMRRRGPAWPRHFTYKSQHYEIHSDIDVKVCQAAGSVLENAYVNLKGQLGWLQEGPEFERFQVFLFSGESGYQEYNKHILGTVVPHTAGVYSPVLKQLLIWNLPKRDDMARTIRHEGFHQYLDRAMADPPVWVNEGMAEFWETARRENGSLQGGQVRRDHLATLLRSSRQIPPSREFVYGTRADFYRSAPLRYAQGWALVHFLRKGPAANQKRFKALWDALRSPDLSSAAALDRAFKDVDWKAFDVEFWKYVQTLADAR